MSSAAKPRRRSPSLFVPSGLAGYPCTVTNGGTSCSTIATGGDHRVRAHAAELVHAREAAQHAIADVDMPRELRVVRERRVVADDAIVRDVHVREQPVAVADARVAAILHGPGVDRDVLADHVVVADRGAPSARHRTCGPAGCRRSRRTGRCGCARRCVVRPVDDDMRPDARARADAHVRPDDRVWRRPRRPLRARRGRRPAQSDGSLAITRHGAGRESPRSARLRMRARRRPTARVRNLPMPRITRTTSASRISWSPGTTCLLEARVVDAGEVDQRAAAGLRVPRHEASSPDTCASASMTSTPGISGIAGKMALEERLVDRDVLDAARSTCPGVHSSDAVDEQERIAVRQRACRSRRCRTRMRIPPLAPDVRRPLFACASARSSAATRSASSASRRISDSTRRHSLVRQRRKRARVHARLA